MAQTPISNSTTISYNRSTIYTVPAATTAVVKTIQTFPVVSSGMQATLFKVSGGVTYPIQSYNVPYTPQYGSNTVAGYNALLSGPITLAAGDSITAQTSFEALPSINSTTGLSWNTNYIAWKVNKYANGIWLIAGNSVNNSGAIAEGDPYLVTSSNGTTFTPITFTDFFYFYDVTFGTANTWVATGYNNTSVSSATPGVYYYSTNNGSTWTKGTISGATGYTIQCWYLNGNYLVTTSTGQLFYSTNATTWTDTGFSAYQTGVILTSATYLNSKYQFGSIGYGLYQTTNLSTWTSPYFSATSDTYANQGVGIIYNPNSSKYFAVTNGVSGTAALTSSTDGITWTPVNTGFTGLFASNSAADCIAYCGGSNNYMVLSDANYGTNSLLYSTNGGTTWTQGSLPIGSAYQIRGIGNGVFFVGNTTNNQVFNLTLTPWSGTGTQYTTSTSGVGFQTAGSYWNLVFATSGTGFFGVYADANGKWARITNTANTASGATINGEYGLLTSTYGSPVAAAYFNSAYYFISTTGYVFKATSIGGTLTVVSTSIFGQGTASNAQAIVFNSKLIIWNSFNNGGFVVSSDGVNFEQWEPNFISPSAFNFVTNYNWVNRVAAGGSQAVFYSCGTGAPQAEQTIVTTNGYTWTTLPASVIALSTANGTTFAWTQEQSGGTSNGLYTTTDPSSPSSYTLVYGSNNVISRGNILGYNTIAQAMYANSTYHLSGVDFSGLISSTSGNFGSWWVTNAGYNYTVEQITPGATYYTGRSNSLPSFTTNGTNTVMIDNNANTSNNPNFDIYTSNWSNAFGAWVTLGAIQIS